MEADLTYNFISTIVKNKLKTCANVGDTNYNALLVNSRQVETWTFGHQAKSYPNRAGTTNNEYFQMVSSNPISKVTTTQIDTDMSNFLVQIGVPLDKVNYTIDQNNITNFIYDMVLFATTKGGFLVSQRSTSAVTNKKYVYLNKAIDINQIKRISITSESQDLIIDTLNLKDIVNRMVSLIKANTRVHPLKFTFQINI